MRFVITSEDTSYPRLKIKASSWKWSTIESWVENLSWVQDSFWIERLFDPSQKVDLPFRMIHAQIFFPGETDAVLGCDLSAYLKGLPIQKPGTLAANLNRFP